MIRLVLALFALLALASGSALAAEVTQGPLRVSFPESVAEGQPFLVEVTLAGQAGGATVEWLGKRAPVALEKRGAKVFDLDADTGSEKRKAFLAVVDADIGNSNRGRASKLNGEKSKRGRKPLHFTVQQLRDAKAIWRNVKDYPDWEAAQAALDAEVPGFTTARAHRAWGGRN